MRSSEARAGLNEAHDHAVQFYDDETFLATVVAEFLAAGLAERRPAAVIATSSHRRAFLARLRADGVDVAAVRRSGQLTLLDARQTLDRLMVGAMPDQRQFVRVIGGLLGRKAAAWPGAPPCAYGEMVDLLWTDGNREGAIRLEELWNELSAHRAISLLCAYSMSDFERSADAAEFERICAQHSHVSPTERYLQADDAAKLVEISLLQQRARALEAEVRQREALEQQLRDAVTALQSREEDLRDVLENAAEGIHLVGSDGVIQWANDAELQMLGYHAEEYLGRHVAEFYVEGEVIGDILDRLARGETLREREAQMRHRDGSIRHVLINSNVRWDGGRFMHTRCFTRDITALREASVARERALERERLARAAAERAIGDAERARAEAESSSIDAQRARAVAEQANRAKSEFLAVMSHELRTPLNAIGGYAELMELGIHGPITESQRESLERIQRSQRMLLGLVNQVLNYARVETGNVRYDIADVPLDESLRAIEGLVAPQLRAKGLRYGYDGCDAALSVRADGEKLQQIVLNLLTNAMKFTDRGGTITLTAEPLAELIRIRVSDSGIGIPEEKREVIFDPFVQVDANYTRTRDGVGLGLAISRDLARGMGGNLVVESTDGEGSVFILTVPRAS